MGLAAGVEARRRSSPLGRALACACGALWGVEAVAPRPCEGVALRVGVRTPGWSSWIRTIPTVAVRRRFHVKRHGRVGDRALDPTPATRRRAGAAGHDGDVDCDVGVAPSRSRWLVTGRPLCRSARRVANSACWTGTRASGDGRRAADELHNLRLPIQVSAPVRTARGTAVTCMRGVAHIASSLRRTPAWGGRLTRTATSTATSGTSSRACGSGTDPVEDAVPHAVDGTQRRRWRTEVLEMGRGLMVRRPRARGPVRLRLEGRHDVDPSACDRPRRHGRTSTRR